MTTPEKSPTRDHPEEFPSSKNEKATIELENQYEHKLALELERFDHLSEEIESIQQRCSLLQAQTIEHEAAIRDAEGRTKRVGGAAPTNERLYEDAKHNEHMFREVNRGCDTVAIDQQHGRFLTSKSMSETELQHLGCCSSRVGYRT